ncbi:hypothetical protein D3C84_368220 [compost metagenome]|uniref:Polysaccharide biosynthesis protein C-terminal domain-containing protein n=2 Tax=Pseudomonas fluorescens TaxID=294 RepID=A0A5E7SBK0_PSEFL|nr:hypothetical protein PS938_00965 [Pseudomonas fluorescens]
MRYLSHLKSIFIPMLLSRAIPVAGITVLFSLIAHKSNNGLAVFSYALAIFTIISALSSMCLSATGNIVASPSSDIFFAQRVFSSGLCLSVVISAIGTFVALIIARYIQFLPGAQNLNEETLQTLALLYIVCIPLAVTNTFLHLFHESSGLALTCTKIKTFVTCAGCIFLGVAFFTANAHLFLFLAMSYFGLTELIAFSALVKLSADRSLKFRLFFCRKTIKQTLTLGFPIAVGLGGQKIYFYFLNERLAILELQLVAELAVFMTLVGVLLIPYITLSQAHSLYISKTTHHRIDAYGLGFVGLIVLTAALLIPGLLLDDVIFALIGGRTLPPSPALLKVLPFFLVSNGLLSLTMGHLRGMHDTLTPQLVVNLATFLTLVPVFYFITPAPPSLTWYMAIQSLALLCIWAVLTARIVILHRRQIAPTTVSEESRTSCIDFPPHQINSRPSLTDRERC